MAIISTIGAGLFTEVEFADNATVNQSDLPSDDSENGTLIALSAWTSNKVALNGIREFPAFGKPANVVNVPQYGQANSSQISGQSDAPILEFSLNYIPSAHKAVQDKVNDGKEYLFTLNMKNSESGDNGRFWVKAQIAGFEVTPNLTDSNQATLTLATQGDFVGPFAD